LLWAVFSWWVSLLDSKDAALSVKLVCIFQAVTDVRTTAHTTFMPAMYFIHPS